MCILAYNRENKLSGKEFLKSVEGKLKNERFVNNAPEQVVAVERKKQADALSKITVLQEQIATLS